MWSAWQQCVQGPKAVCWWSGTHKTRPPGSHVFRSTFRLDWVMQTCNHPAGSVNCYLEETAGFCLYIWNSTRNHTNTNGSTFTWIKHILCRLWDIEKVFSGFSLKQVLNPPQLLLTVMSEDTVKNPLIYAWNVSCLFWCHSLSAEPTTVAANSESEFAERLPGKHQQSLIMQKSSRSGSRQR